MENKPGFDELLNNVVLKGICASCGACVAVCPINVLAYEKMEPKLVGKCTNCGICLRVCPRYKSPFAEAENFVFGRQRKPEEEYGIYKQAMVARSADEEILARAQDGGVVTTLLASALESGLIDAAIVSSVNSNNPWEPLPLLAKTRSEIISSAGTRYSLSPGLTLLKSAVTSGLSKIAFVGTPCQILAVRRIQKSLSKYAKSIALTIGLFCTENFRHDGLMVEKIQKELGVNLNDIKKVNIKGKFLVHQKSGETKEIPLKELLKFAIASCHNCGDFSAELSDISCGGVGLDGKTYTLIRTDKGAAVFEDVVKKGMLKIEPVENFPFPTKILVKLSKDKRNRSGPQAP
ncbi:MAG: Coenzyme F420 hydrogenase/dehydrogenase, beta subunit C-terminal domain [Methanobacteriota archaeon]